MKTIVFSLTILSLVICGCDRSDESAPIDVKPTPTISVKLEGTILFLGDANTYAGQFISILEAILVEKGSDSGTELINLGMPGETCAVLPQADPKKSPLPSVEGRVASVDERIDRALDRVKPNAVFVCYGLNDGFYSPFSEERFSAYQKGINSIINKVHAAGVQLVLMTPPPLDTEALRAKGTLKPAGQKSFSFSEIYENYDVEVLAKYSEWILQQRSRVEGVIDLRSPILSYSAESRKTDSGFVFSNAVGRPNVNGHRVIAKSILSAIGEDPAQVESLRNWRFQQAKQRQKILRNAWLSHVGHTYSGLAPGMPLEDARKAANLIGSENEGGSQKPVSGK